MTDHPAPIFDLAPDDIARLSKSGARHKYDYGHAVIISGPAGQGGAARLAARAALRIGAGLVSVASSKGAVSEHAGQLNAIMIKPVGDGAALQDDLRALKPDAICIGPNLGTDERALRKLSAVMQLPIPQVIDADAITLLSQNRDLMDSLANAASVLTPHDGELRRLIADIFADTTCRETRVKAAAKMTGCVVLSKGVETLIARPDGVCACVPSNRFRHAAWLATAGSGDVLSGMITGLLARGFDGFDAAKIGAILHFLCAETLGPGLTADDLPDALRSVLKSLLTSQSCLAQGTHFDADLK